MEDEDLCANLPPAELPATEDIGHVVVHSVDEEEVPSLEALREDGHLAETTTRATARDEDSGRCFGFDEYLRAHLDATSEFAGNVTEEPIFRDTETGVFVESLDEEFAVPKGDSTVGEGGRTNLTSKLALDTTELVFEILGLLAKIAL